MEVIKMDYMILHVLGTEHEVPDHLGIGRYGDAKGILHSSHRSQGMHGGAYTANPFSERPGIPGIATFKDELEPTNHGP